MDLLAILVVGFSTLFILMTLVWIIQRVLKNAGVVDVFWGMGIVILTGIYALALPGSITRRSLIFYMVSTWGLRLSWHILKRFLREKEEDRRYQVFREAWQDNVDLKFFILFQSQTSLQFFLCVPFFIIAQNKAPFSWIELLGILVWFIGLLGEYISDEQLKYFKSDPSNKGKVCDVGLWQYSRHPNYFFEWVIWVGFFLFGLASPHGWMGIISPALMLVLLLKVSGVPMAEAQSLKSKGDLYKAYQKTTSVFIPLPKRKS